MAERERLMVPADPVSEVKPEPLPGDPVARHKAAQRYGERTVAVEGRMDRASARTYSRKPQNWRPYDEAS